MRVAGGRNQAEAELIQNILLEEGVPSIVRRTAGYDVQKPVLAVREVSRNSAAARVGLRKGDLVLSVNSAEVDTMKEFEKALSQARKSGRAVLLVQRGYRLQEFAFDLG